MVQNYHGGHFEKCKKMTYKSIFVGGGEHNESSKWHR